MVRCPTDFLVLQCLPPFGFRDLHPAKLRLPFVGAGVADTCLRHRSATETPASCSFKIPMICSSEKRLRFMLWSSSGPERTSSWIKLVGQGQRGTECRRRCLGRSGAGREVTPLLFGVQICPLQRRHPLVRY